MNSSRFTALVSTALLVACASTHRATLAEESLAADQTETAGSQSEWITLFDGSSLTAWRGYQTESAPGGWVIEDGTLHRKSRGGDMMTVEKFDHFELTLQWKVAQGSNSGILYRVRQGDNAPYMSGPEYQILDNENHADGSSDLTSCASLYGLYPCRPGLCQPVGEWNQTRIVVRGNHVEHWLNGEKVVECELWSDDWKARLENSKFKGWPQFAKTVLGHLVLQDHGDPVWYRDIKIRPLTAPGTP